jgi:hypothetical protein
MPGIRTIEFSPNPSTSMKKSGIPRLPAILLFDRR